jgi:hypothetical protein
MKRPHPHSDTELKNVSHAPYVVIGEVLRKIEIYPPVLPGIPLHEDVVAPDIAVAQIVVMEELDGLKAIAKLSEDSRHRCMKIFFMRSAHILNHIKKGRASNKLERPYFVAAPIRSLIQACSDSFIFARYHRCHVKLHEVGHWPPGKSTLQRFISTGDLFLDRNRNLE